MSNNDKKKEALKQSDYITSRVLVGFATAGILLWVMSRLQHMMDFGSTLAQGITTARITAIAAAAFFVVGMLLYIRSVRLHKNRPDSIFNGAYLAIVSFGVLCSTLLLLYSTTIGMRITYILFPLMAILFLVFSVYQRQFFTLCITHSAIAFLLWGLSSVSFGSVRGYRIMILVSALTLCVAAVLLAFLSRGAFRRAIFGTGISNMSVCAIYGATAAAVVLAFILGQTIAFYAAIGAIAFLLGALVYYTVKLM